jgi:glycosyltransferase involved in cell wall biosynthesis
MVVSGFPTPNRPWTSVFNLRAAQLLSAFVDVRVIHLRAWLPGRRVVSTGVHEGIGVTTLALPQTPGMFLHNILAFQRMGWPLVGSMLSGCDLLHSVDLTGAGIPVSYWAHRGRVRHVVQVIGSDLNTVLDTIRPAPDLKFMQENTHAAACNSKALAAGFRERFPGIHDVEAIYRGVDLDHFCPAGPACGPLEGLPPVRFLFLGGFPADPALAKRWNVKGGETLLEAWKASEGELHAKGASLLVAGPDSDCDRVGRWRDSLRWPERVFLGGMLAPGLTREFMRSADVVLVPSIFEGLPNVALEAEACGRAVLGSAIPGLSEAVDEGETGTLVPAGDAGALARAMLDLASDPEKLHLMGGKARAWAESRFDRRQHLQSLLALYERVIARPY